LRTRPLKGGYNREITYYAKSDLDRVRDARAEKVVGVAPEQPEMVHVDKAASELGCHLRTVYRRARATQTEVKYRAGKDGKGRGMPRSYLPQQFIEDAKQLPVLDSKMTAADAADSLGVSKSDIHNLIKAGLLDAESGEGLTRAAARPGGTTLRYRRKATLVSTEQVNQLKAAMAVLRAPSPESRPGRPAGSLRRAAEALRDGSIQIPADPPAQPANDGATQATLTEPATRRRRRGPKISERTLKIGKVCYDLLASGELRKVICKHIAKELNRPMSLSDVTTYARRYAQNPDDPKSWPI
jgi:hypothetical protein